MTIGIIIYIAFKTAEESSQQYNFEDSGTQSSDDDDVHNIECSDDDRGEGDTDLVDSPNNEDYSNFMDIDANEDEVQRSVDEVNGVYFSIVRWVILVFFRVLHKFSISNTAATCILSVIMSIIAHPLSKIFPKTLASATKIASNEVIEKRLYGTLLGFERQLSFEKKKWTPFNLFHHQRG